MSLLQILVKYFFFPEERGNTLSSSRHPIEPLLLDLVCSNFMKRWLLKKDVFFPKANIKNHSHN